MTAYPASKIITKPRENQCMASGGGSSHPSHLPISSRNNQAIGGSLQTPDASALFISSLGESTSGSRSRPIVNNFAPSPLDQTQSFTSLEELLNVTGISSSELDQSGSGSGGGGMGKDRDGVDSLQRMAKEVEKNQGKLEFPPSKRARLDSSASSPGVSSSSHREAPPLHQITHVPSNIRVQPLHPSPPQPALLSSSSSTPSFTSMPTTSPLLSNAQNSTTPIASLLSFSGSPSTHLGSKIASGSALPNAHQSYPSKSSSGGGSMRSPPQMSGPPPPYNYGNTPSPQTLPARPGNATANQTTTSRHPSAYLNQFPSTQPSSSHTEPSGGGMKFPSSATLPPQSSSSAIPQVGRSQAGYQQGPATASKLADSINSSSQSVVHQLKQLYKHYQELNDREGMGRVLDQISLLVSAHQKIFAAQSTGPGKTDTISVATTSTAGGVGFGGSLSSSQLQPVPKSATVGLMSNRVSPQLQQQQQQQQQKQQQQQQLQPQQQANQILSQLVSKKAPAPTWQGPGSKFPRADVSEASSSGVLSNSTQVGGSGTGLERPTPPLPSYSEASSSLAASTTGVHGSNALVNTPPSLLGHMTATPTSSSESIQQNNNLMNSQANTQRIVKQIKMLIATLPESKRPKSNQELREIVQKCSSLISRLPQSTQQPTISSGYSPVPKTPATFADKTKTQGAPASAVQPPPPIASTSSSNSEGFSQIGASSQQAVNANIAEHFKNSLLASSASRSSLGSSSQGVQHSVLGSSQELPLRGTPPTRVPVFIPQFPGSEATKQQQQQQQQQFSAGTMHAPVTTQFSHTSATPPLTSAGTTPSQLAIMVSNNQTPSTTTTSSGIQAGIATPLPPGLTLETLNVLCRLPEADLLKLKLPPALLSAIKVWKAGQMPTKSKVSSATSKSSIPVLFPPSESASNSSSMVTLSKLPSSHHPPPKTSLGQPNVIPSFPPRSLHAYVPGGTNSIGTATNSLHQLPISSNHMTRYKVKQEQQKVKNERLQVLQKALQTSEEARIAFRFSAHLEKMHTQLTNPDTINSFRSQHDVLARLLPYHLYAEPEPPPAAVEKADAVFESVAQVLLSCSRGLRSRFKQATIKADAEGNSDLRAMEMQLDKLFVEGEHERIQKENLEKKQAEQIAADLSLMADHMDSFDSSFSLGDVFDPMLSDSGIT